MSQGDGQQCTQCIEGSYAASQHLQEPNAVCVFNTPVVPKHELHTEACCAFYHHLHTLRSWLGTCSSHVDLRDCSACHSATSSKQAANTHACSRDVFTTPGLLATTQDTRSSKTHQLLQLEPPVPSHPDPPCSSAPCPAVTARGVARGFLLHNAGETSSACESLQE